MMDQEKLINMANALIARDKEPLAIDESTSVDGKDFAALGIPQTVEARQGWWDLIVTTPRLGDSINGAILYDETIRQQTADGKPFVKILVATGIIPGIKIDRGQDMVGHLDEKVTEGHNGLRDPLKEFASMRAFRDIAWRNRRSLRNGITTGAVMNVIRPLDLHLAMNSPGGGCAH
jgi:fructose-bisphosphate aldolase class I